MSYTHGASSGNLVAGGAGPGIALTQLNYPMGLYFQANTSTLYIANAGANNIVSWVLGRTNCTVFLGSSLGSAGIGSSSFRYPTDLTFDSSGNIYVADNQNHRIQFFLSGQGSATTIAGVTGVAGGNASLLRYPSALALDSSLNLYVTDTGNHRVQKFQFY